MGTSHKGDQPEVEAAYEIAQRRRTQKIVGGLIAVVLVCLSCAGIWAQHSRKSMELNHQRPYKETLIVKISREGPVVANNDEVHVAISKEDGEEVARGLYPFDTPVDVAQIPPGRYIATAYMPRTGEEPALHEKIIEPFEIVEKGCEKDHDHATAHATEIAIMIGGPS